MAEPLNPQAAPAGPSSASVAPTEQGAPAPSSSPGVDISRSTIVVLVLLTLVISILGTWTVLNEVSAVRVQPRLSGPATADVKLNILSEQQLLAQQAAAEAARHDKATGQVIFSINP